MIKSIKKIITNIQGWKTNRKIIVIESDDWGSIRMPSKEVYNKSINNGYKVDLNPYERYDSLASEEDLTYYLICCLSLKIKMVIILSLLQTAW